MKKTKKQGENLSNDKIIHRRKLRSSNPDQTEPKTTRQQIISIKKERKKRIKKILHQPEQGIQGKNNSSK